LWPWLRGLRVAGSPQVGSGTKDAVGCYISHADSAFSVHGHRSLFKDEIISVASINNRVYFSKPWVLCTVTSQLYPVSIPRYLNLPFRFNQKDSVNLEWPLQHGKVRNLFLQIVVWSHSGSGRYQWAIFLPTIRPLLPRNHLLRNLLEA
jgi:hypothetical protein